MKKGQVYEGLIEKVEFPNKGIIPMEDRRVCVKNTLPGQKVRFVLQKLRKGNLPFNPSRIGKRCFQRLYKSLFRNL